MLEAFKYTDFVSPAHKNELRYQLKHNEELLSTALTTYTSHFHSHRCILCADQQDFCMNHAARQPASFMSRFLDLFMTQEQSY